MWGSAKKANTRRVWQSAGRRSLLAAAVVVLMAANLGGSGISGLPAGGRQSVGAQHLPYPKGPKPGQRWGTAAGLEHLTGKPGNDTVPPSLRATYPVRKLNQKPQPGRNTARVVAPLRTAKAKSGFDPETSKLRADLAPNESTKVYENADGSQTTVFNTLPVAPGAADGTMYVHGGSSVANPDELRVGRLDGANAASYIKFGGLVDSLRFHTILGVALQVVSYDAPSCRAKPVSVHPVTGAWTPGSGYSYPGPAVDGPIATESFAHGYIALGQTESACPADGVVFDLGQGGQALVQRWVDGTQANNGLSLRAPTGDGSAWKRLVGTAPANRPHLYVTHSPYNASYAIPNPVPDPPVLQNQAGKVKVSVTNKSAAAWAPADYYLAYRAYNAETGEAVTQQRAANLPGTVARGATVTLDATIQPLPPGQYFLDFTMVRTGGEVFTDHQVPPGRIVLEVFDIPPVLQELHPPNGYQTPTLTPQLWAAALDIDAPSGSTLQYKFEVCDRNDAGDPVSCTDSGYLAKQAWAVPAGRLVWSKTYLWRAFVKDANNEVPSPYSALLTAVPQPEITSRIAGAPYGSKDKEFDAQVGNLSTAAVDASVSTVGPELNVVRTYNSLDPRRDSAFGAGWVSRYDMKLLPDDDGSGNVVVSYPDGQMVRYGRNPDGTYAAPMGRTASLTLTPNVSFTLTDKSRTKYVFGLPTATAPGQLREITDAAGRSLVFTLDTSNGKLSRVQVRNSQTNTAGRSLRFTWQGNHVATVSTDPVNGAALTWNYTYTGDLLTKVCAPNAACTSYEYTAGSHFRSAVTDSKPESYWRLGEPQGTSAGSEIAVNLGKDAGTYKNVTLAAPGALPGTADTAASFNGSSSYVELPKGTLKKNRDAAVELWFKIGLTQTGGPLLGYQDKAVGTAATAGVPILYTGSDGLLRGQFAMGAVNPIVSTKAVNDNQWHHVVLSAMGSTQTLYLDGVKMGERTGTIDQAALTFNQIGAASATPPASWAGWGATAQRHFAGVIDEVALYAHPLGPAAVTAHYRYGTAAADQLGKVTLPSGKVAITAAYDTAADRIKEFTDRNGGTWKIGVPTVYGGDTDLRRGVQVLDPGNRPYLFEYDALAGRMLRSGTPLGLEMREEDRPGQPNPTPSPSPTPVCARPDPNDPAFCTTIPGNAGGPIFVRHPVDGMAIRSYFYDDRGFQNKIVNENGNAVEMTYDARGNATTKKTCRTSTQCYQTYYTYPATVTDPTDPRNNLPTEMRDGRSASATDNTYVTRYTYHASGELARQTNPDGSYVEHTYTSGAGAGTGGIAPAGLPETTRDARGKMTRYLYYHNGDVHKVTDPRGQVTEFTYDALGRKLTEKVISDAYPSGVTTNYTYDAVGRAKTNTGPVTTNAVTGTRHQAQTVVDYDADGNVIRTTVKDLLGGDAERVATADYDEHNRVVLEVDAEGNETSHGYDRYGNPTFLQDANGNRFEYAYTARNMKAEVRLREWRGDPAGAPDTGEYLVLHSYSYDHAGRLASDTDAMGQRLEYQYYGDDLMHKITLKDFRNPNGTKRDYVVEENTYDGAGHLSKKVVGNGRLTTTHTMDRGGQVDKTITDPGGLARTTDYDYDGNGNVIRVTNSGVPSNVPGFTTVGQDVVEFVYDDDGNLQQETTVAGSARQTTSYEYDQRGAVTSKTDPRGNVTRFTNDELGRQVGVVAPTVKVESNGGPAADANPTTAVGYNTFGEAVNTRDPLGNVRRAEYDKLGRQTAVMAPSYTPPGGVAVTPTTRVRYDGLGNVVEVTDPRNAVTRYTYDQLNRVTVRDEPATTNDERAVWRYTYTRTGEVLSVTDPTGARVESTYDDLDRRVTMTEVERKPTGGNLTTRYGYDDAANPTSIAAPSGATTNIEYDALGQLTKSTSPNSVVTQYGYDHAGRQIRMADGLGRTSRVAYDGFGRQTVDLDQAPNGTELRRQDYGYDAVGNLTSATDPYRKVTTYEYDALNRLTKQIEPVTDTKSLTTTFGYDAASNRTRYTDGRGNSTVYTVNSLGLSESVIEPATTAHPAAADRTWTVGYNAAGDAVRLSAPGGVVRSRSFDAAGRLDVETGSGGEAATAQRNWDYDLADRLIGMSAPGGTNAYTYNDRGGLLTASGPSGVASFGYDVDGLVSSRTDAAGTATFTYDRGRLHTMKDAVTGATQTLGYNAAGQESTVDYGSGRVRTFGYDDFGRMTSDVLRNAAGQTVSSVTYVNDLNDHLTNKTTTGTAGAGQNTYQYDYAGRLTSWTGPKGTVGYEWDDSGNRVRAGGKTATFDERNRLLSDGDYTYQYTARGTQRSRTSSGLVEEYSFDAFDRLVNAGGETYTYDGLDRVVARNDSAFSYAGLSDEPVTDGVELYARGPSDELLAVSEAGVKRLTLEDAHGDVVAQFDPTNTTLPALNDSTAFDPWGKRIESSGSAQANIGYQGDWTDPETGQVDMGARWYQPGTGTFTSRDSVTYQSGDSVLANRYTYGAGAPLDFTDPDGHWPQWVDDTVNWVGGAGKAAWNGAKWAAGKAYSGAKWVAGKVWNGAKWAAGKVWSGAKWAASQAWSAIKTVGNWVSSGASWLFSKVKSGLSWAMGKVAAGIKWIGNKIASAARAVGNWAKDMAQKIGRAAVAVAKGITNAAKAAAKWVAQNNPLKMIAAAAKPLLSGLGKIVSTVASLPAKFVAVMHNVIDDVSKTVKAVYNKAMEMAGNVIDTVSNAIEAANNWINEHKAEIAGFVVGGLAGIGCGIAIGWTGIGAVACAAGAGALGSAVTGYMNGERGWDLAGTAAMGGVFGGLFGGLGSVAAAGIGSAFRGMAGGLASGVKGFLGGAGDELASIFGGRFVGGLFGRGGAGGAGKGAAGGAGKGAARGCNSFTGTTGVLMADGSTKAISEVRVGDKVVATDPTTGKTETREVTRLRSGADQSDLVEVVVDIDGITGEKTGSVVATDEHPFWVEVENRWVYAKDLKPGYRFETSDHRSATVVRTRTWSEYLTVYNLTVDGIHTYYVLAGNAAVLVHNTDPCKLAADYIANGWNAKSVLPSGKTIGQVGRDIWGNGKPSADRLAGMSNEQLRGLASLEDAKVLNAVYADAAAKIPSNQTAPVRVDLTQQVIDAWGSK
ncbi:polymorphic toxin-type HINT domain-containing protein [Actinomycetes bacterium KLBMP 9797]